MLDREFFGVLHMARRILIPPTSDQTQAPAVRVPSADHWMQGTPMLIYYRPFKGPHGSGAPARQGAPVPSLPSLPSPSHKGSRLRLIPPHITVGPGTGGLTPAGLTSQAQATAGFQPGSASGRRWWRWEMGGRREEPGSFSTAHAPRLPLDGPGPGPTPAEQAQLSPLLRPPPWKVVMTTL